MKGNRRYRLRILSAIILALCILAGCGAETDFTAEPGGTGAEYTSYSDLSGKTVSMLTGAPFEELVRSKAPDVGEFTYFNNTPDMLLALEAGKTDAVLINNAIAELAVNRDPDLALFPQNLQDGVFGLAFQKGDPARDQWQAAYDTISEEEKQALWEKWTGSDESAKVLPEQDWPGKNGTVQAAVCDTLEPMSYAGAGGKLIGFDVEMILRMAKELDVHVEFTGMEFSAILSSVQSGKATIGAGSIIVTDERSEAVDFVEYYPAAFVLIVRSGQARSEVRWQDYNGKRLGVLVGPLMEDAAAEYFPDSEYLLLNSYPDCIAALLAGKIDAYLGDEPGLKSTHAENPQIDYIHDNITENNYAFAFRKDDSESAALCAELNEFLARCWADGTMEELDDIWLGVDESRKVVDMSDLTGENGTIHVATTSTDMPWSYIKDGKNVGYDIDLVVRFCRDRGYALELGDMDFAGRIPAVQSGKFDFTTDMNVTPEREEQVLFSEPTSHGGIVLAVLASDLAAPASGETGGGYTSADDLRGKTIACTTGSVTAAYVEEYFNGDVTVKYFDSHTDMVFALNSGKIDAYCTDSVGAKIQSESSGGTIHALEPPIHTTPVGFIFQKGSEQSETVRSQLNEYLTGLGRDRLSALQDYWLGDDEDLEAIDMTFTGENGHLKMAVSTGFGKPWCYVKDGSIVGFEMQLAADFCREYGYSLEFVDYDFQGMLAAVQSGKCDMAGSAILRTPERMEQVDYSEPTGNNVFVLVTSSSKVSAAGSETAGAALADMEQASIAVLSGTSIPQVVEQRLPGAEILFYNTTADEVNALKSGKVEAIAIDEPVARNMMAEDSSLAMVPELLDTIDYAFALGQSESGEALCVELDEYLRAMKTDGSLEELQSKWFDTMDITSVEMEDYRELPAVNGTVHLAAFQYPPFVLMNGDRLGGYEIELMTLFCQDRGYALEISDMSNDAILPAVQSGKSDVGCCGLSVTEERKESMLFTEPDYSGGTALLVLKESAAETGGGFLSSVGDSFQKTFIRENRWKLFAQGIGTTLLITVLSIIFGTALGFGVFMLCRNGNPVANTITRFCVWLVRGMPVVVLLMILYYIIFGNVAIPGTAVAVIGFTLVFGAGVYGIIKSGVGAIDKGQLEAAYALGYTNRRAFFRVILPQALPHFMPAYKGSITEIIKATAIVGYVAVQDLTKMGDIVRSRTYEAFFPLIAVAVIYFILAAVLTWIVNRIELRIDPKQRKIEDIRKEVEGL